VPRVQDIPESAFVAPPRRNAHRRAANVAKTPVCGPLIALTRSLGVVAKAGAARYEAQLPLGGSRPALTGPYVNTLGASHGVRSLRAWRDQWLDLLHERRRIRRGPSPTRGPLNGSFPRFDFYV